MTNLAGDKPAPLTGDLITLTWNDVNSGNTAVNGGWFDRITVLNQTTATMLINQQLRFDPAAGTVVQPGATISRTFSFRVPDGSAGAGTLLIQVMADQNTAGAGTLTEANVAGTGEDEQWRELHRDRNARGVSQPQRERAGRARQCAWRRAADRFLDGHESRHCACHGHLDRPACAVPGWPVWQRGRSRKR